MRRLATACALASLTLVAGCGSDSSGSSGSAAASNAGGGQSSAAAAATSASASAGGSGAATVLTGMVGTKADPNAFAISLTDASGQPVSTLPAGKYTIQVHDLSAMHNFHLTGGSIDEKTAVPEVVDTTFDVTLTAGNYTFKCDPHAKMAGSFTVS